MTSDQALVANPENKPLPGLMDGYLSAVGDHKVNIQVVIAAQPPPRQLVTNANPLLMYTVAI